jgi:FMN phosphatase YigB (HAD superfamily)
MATPVYNSILTPAINTFVFDLERVLLFPQDRHYSDNLDKLYRQYDEDPNYLTWEIFYLNNPLLFYLKSVVSFIDLYLFTQGTVHLDPPINQLLAPIFKRTFLETEIGAPKNSPESYQKLLLNIDRQPQQVIYIDDSIDHVKAALEAGILASHFHDTDKLITHLSGTLDKYYASK